MAYEEDSCIRGYHLYQAIWTAVVDECLVCQREPLNSSDRWPPLPSDNGCWASRFACAMAREGIVPDREPLGLGRRSLLTFKYFQLRHVLSLVST